MNLIINKLLSSFIIFLLTFSSSSINEFKISDLDKYECLNGEYDSIKKSKYLIIALFNIDCSYCLSTLNDWKIFYDKINSCPEIAFIAFGYGKHKIRFEYLLLHEFDNLNFTIFYNESKPFENNLILISKKNEIAFLPSPFLNQKSKKKFLSIINDMCSNINY